MKSQVAIFVVVAMVLRRKPDVLISILPTLRENSKYQGQDNLPVIVWMIVQVSGIKILHRFDDDLSSWLKNHHRSAPLIMHLMLDVKNVCVG